MKKLALIISVLSLLLVPAAAYAHTPLSNSGFETGSLTPWLQLGFHNANVENAAAYSGSFGLRIAMESPVQGDGWGGRYQNKPAAAGEVHYFNGWINTQNLNTLANATLQIAYFQELDPGVSANPLSAFDTSPITGLEWTQVSLTSAAPAPVGTQSVRYTLAVWGNPSVDFPGTGYAYFDDVDGNIIPEPSSLILLGSGIIGMLSISRKKKKA